MLFTFNYETTFEAIKTFKEVLYILSGHGIFHICYPLDLYFAK